MLRVRSLSRVRTKDEPVRGIGQEGNLKWNILQRTVLFGWDRVLEDDTKKAAAYFKSATDRGGCGATNELANCYY